MEKVIECYNLLKANPNDSDEILKLKFKKAAMKNHPDRGGNAEDFDKISRAYKVLTSHRQAVSQLKTTARSQQDFLDAFFGGKTGPYARR